MVRTGSFPDALRLRALGKGLAKESKGCENRSLPEPDLSRDSGSQLSQSQPQGVFMDKKINLSTGKVTF